MMQTRPPAPPTQRLMPTWIALVVVWCAALVNQPVVFGLLFLAWAGYDVFTGESVFVQRLTRREQPLAFWLVVSTWLAFGALSIAVALWGPG